MAPASVVASKPDSAELPRLTVDSGVLQPESVIELTFSKPVAKENEVNREAEPGFLEITPPLPGHLFWKTTRVAQYRLAAAPLAGTEYRVSLGKVPAVLRRTGLSGGELGTVKTAPFKLERVETPGFWGGDLRHRTPMVYCWFTDDVAPDAVAPHAFFIDDSGKRIGTIAWHASVAESRRFYRAVKSLRERFLELPGVRTAEPRHREDWELVENEVILNPIEPLPPGQHWKLHLFPGFRPQAGGGAVTEEFDRQLGSINPLAVRSGKPSAVSVPGEGRKIVVGFDQELADKEPDVAQAQSCVEVLPPVSRFKVRVSWSNLEISGDFQPKAEYTVRIKAGLKAQNGLALEKMYQDKTRFNPCEPTLTLPSTDSAQFAKGRRQYEVHSVNMKAVRVRVKALNGTDLVRAWQAYGQYMETRRDGNHLRGTGPLPFELISGTTVYDERQEFAKETMDSLDAIHLDWSKILGASKPAALFVSAEAWHRDDLGLKEQNNKIVQALVQVTDLGVAWKRDPAGVLFYVFSCNTGEPVSGAEIQLSGEDAKELQKLVTDSQGVAHLPAMKDGVTVKVQKGGDQYCVVFDNEMPVIPRYRFPVNFSNRAQQQFRNTVSMFTDRYLYRPGETMHLKGIWRERLDTELRIPGAHEIKVFIRDEDNRVVSERTVKLSDVGTFSETYELPAGTVGEFRAIVELPRPPKIAGLNAESEENEDYDNRQCYSFTESFQVQEFRKNTFEVHVKAPDHPRVAEETEVAVSANYLMGKPLSDARISWEMHAHRVGFYPERYSGYYFGDHARYDRYYWFRYFGFRGYSGDDEDQSEDARVNDSKTGTVRLDPNNPTPVRFPLPKYEFPSRVGVEFRAEVTDANQQTLADSVEYQASCSQFYIGVNRIDSLVRVGGEIPLAFIAVDEDGKPHAHPVQATVSIEHETWTTTVTKTANGDTATHSTSSRKEVFRQDIALNGDVPAALTYVPTEAGSYYVTVRGKDEAGAAVATRVKLDAYGSKDYAWEYEDNARIRLVPDKKQYQPGDTARILVQTPVDGYALISLERNKVHRSFVTKLSTTSPVITVPVTDADAPNVYVSVTLIKGARDNRREVKEPIAKIGYCEVKVADRLDRLNVRLKPAKPVVRPGTETFAEGTVTDSANRPVSNAEVTLWVEDEGVLQVAGYANPDFLETMLPAVPLGVETGTTLPLFLPEDPSAIEYSNKGFTAGGGGASAANKLRVDFNPCPLWVGTIRTGADGAFRANFKTPDSLTRFRILAVAVAGARQFGNAVSAITVNKPLMVQPSAPRVAHVGDRLQVKALVHNTSPYAGLFEVSLQTSDGCPIDSGSGNVRTLARRIRLATNESRAMVFNVGFTATGDAVWNWKAVQVTLDQPVPDADKAELADTVQSKFPVYFPLPLFRESAYQRLNADASEVNLLKKLSPELLAGSGELTVEMTPSILTEAADAIEHVLHYPYGCVEQTTSSMAPWFAAKELRDYIPAMQRSDAEIADAIQRGANRLLSMQTSSGGLAYWPGGTEVCIWGSSYGGMGLLLARENGASIPDEAIQKLLRYLSTVLRQHFDDGYHGASETRARILYILALGGKPEPAYVDTMVRDAAKFSLSARALLAMAIVKGGGSHEQARQVLDQPASVVTEENDLHFLWRNLDVPMQLMAWCMVDPLAHRTTELADALISTRTSEGHWGATINNAWSLNALAAYSHSEEHGRAPLVCNLRGMGVSERFTLSPERKLQSFRIVLKGGTEAPELLASVQGTGQAFCRLHLLSRPKIEPAREVDCGFSIQRAYQRVNPKGGREPAVNLQPGDVVLVTLSVHVPAFSFYVAVEDPLPAILEAVNPEFASQAAPGAEQLLRTNWQMSHVEYRDDRVAFFSDGIAGGRYTLTYLARVTGRGAVMAPPARIEAMYNPEKYGLSASERFENGAKEIDN